MKITDRLLADHKALRKILEDVEADARTPAAQRDPAALRRRVALLKRMVVFHAGVEDRVFFPALGKAGAVASDLLAHLTHEHKTIEGYLERLSVQVEARPPAAAWPQTLALLAAGLRGHFKREEEDVFPASEPALGEELLRALGAQEPSP